MQTRDKWVHFVMTGDEYERMRRKMEEIGIRNQSSYLRKMALDGYCVNLDLRDVKEVVSLLRYCSNNLNQYAKRANETGSIYAEDIQDLKQRQMEIWEATKEILARLATIT
ncbi:plasmid mobilization protein [Oribacterium sp. HCP28S3_H8]|uniref:plasmid mobilization protein n=1 Tax=Oribacterium sp. HCP28S3_H8 TaxID=3438945 RepID=UPI003F886525